MKDLFQVFGEQAEHGLPDIIISGRHGFHDAAMAAVLTDVAGKLRPESTCRLLEIGCGPGLLLRGLAPMVGSAIGLDHPSVAARANEAGLPENVEVIGGRWPADRPSGLFDRILVYSVLHYIEGANAAFAWIDACVDSLAVGGRMLLGDLPNADKAARFANSAECAEVNRVYAAGVEHDREINADGQRIRAELSANAKRPPEFINDSFVLDLLGRLRHRGLDAFVMPQDPRLPFSRSREDILILRRA